MYDIFRALVNRYAEATVTASVRRLDDQVVIVTGAGSGIGRGVCELLASAGAALAVVDIDGDRASAVAAQLEAAGSSAIACQADVSDAGSVAQAVERTMTTLGRIDVLVNNAGLATVVPFLDHELAAWRRVFAVNVEGALMFTQQVARLMVAQAPSRLTGCRGKILNMSSGAADVGRPLLASYGASKAALNHLSKTTAAVLAEDLISTTVIYPTSVADGMWSTLGRDIAEAEGRNVADVIKERTEASPSGRFQTAEEVASIVLFAASWKGMGLNGRLIWSEAHIAAL